MQCITIDAAHATEQELRAHLEHPFLGAKPLFIIVSEQDGVVKPLSTSVASVLSSYNGEHACIVVTPPTQALSFTLPHQSVAFPDKVDQSLLSLLFTLADCESSKAAYFAQKISMHVRDIPLATACSLAWYPSVIGQASDAWCKNWLPHLVPHNHSLFNLSSALLARDKRMFYQLWVALREQYPPEFWLTFWSDLLWNAHYFLLLVKEMSAEQAAKHTKYLPFAFIRGGWRKHSVEQCAQQVERLASFDFLYKRGTTSIPYESVFTTLLAEK
jgi:hypothetical protein